MPRAIDDRRFRARLRRRSNGDYVEPAIAEKQSRPASETFRRRRVENLDLDARARRRFFVIASRLGSRHFFVRRPLVPLRAIVSGSAHHA
jgi:hypothetical protein